MDRPGFPCSCTAEACLNKTGRLEFNPVKVRTHFVRTIMRTRLEAARDLQSHNSYLPSGTLGYLAQMYTRQEMTQVPGQGYHDVAGSSSSSSLSQHWLPQNSWSLDNPWWTFSGGQDPSGMMLEASEAQEEETQEDTESEESEEEVYTDILTHHDEEQLEEVEETVVTDDIQVIPSLAQVEVSQIIDNVVDNIVSEEREKVSINETVTESIIEEEDNDEGIGTDHSEAAHTDSDSGKGEDDSIDRSDYGDSEAKSDEDTDNNAISRSSESLIDHETSSFQPSSCPCLESVPA